MLSGCTSALWPQMAGAGLPAGPCPVSLQSACLRMPCGGSPRSATTRGTALWLLTGPPSGTRASPAQRNSCEFPTPAVRGTRGAGAGGPQAESPLRPPRAVQAGARSSLGRQGAAGHEQGGDARHVLSLQCPGSCWRRWALTPRTPSCSRTTCTVMWG